MQTKRATHPRVIRDKGDHHPLVLAHLLGIESVGEARRGLWAGQGRREERDVILVAALGLDRGEVCERL
jgi:hypothetical protein